MTGDQLAFRRVRSRVSRALLGVILLAAVPIPRAQGQHAESLSPMPGDQPVSTPSVSNLARFEATGLSILKPYARGKIPVILVHGLWMNPWSWSRMIDVFESEPALAGRFQFWTFGYSTGDPIPYSASLFRQNLEEARRQLDPDRSDKAFDRMVIVGHSMGGLLTKMLSVDSGSDLWRVLTNRSFDQLKGEPEDIDLFRRALFFQPVSEIRRVVFIATPHRGSHIDRGSLHRVGTRLVRTPVSLSRIHHRLIERNDPDFFNEHFRKHLPSSIDELEQNSPMIAGLLGVKIIPPIQYHSIIAVKPVSARAERTDGLVSYDSAHLEGAASEKVVSTSHLCQEHPEVIAEVRRILLEHAEH